MTQHIDAEIIAIGTEILLGEITDTNSVYIARLLRDLGINLYFMTSVGDNEGRIADAVRMALGRAHVVITCGGLGPTIDDMTRQGVAAATGQELEFHQYLLDKIAERFAGFGVTMTDNNRRQAYAPAQAIIIENPVGTAPAFIVEQDDRCVISLPGVPREMKYLLTERVVPYLRERYELGIIKARVLKTAGIGESMLDERIGTDLLEAGNPTVGLAAHSGQVDVRITAKATTEAEADTLIAGVEIQLRDRIGSFIFGADGETLEIVMTELLKAKGKSLAISETGVGSIIASRFAALDPSLVHTVHSFAETQALIAEVGAESGSSVRGLAEVAARQIANTDRIGIAIVSSSLENTDHADSAELSAIAVCLNGVVRSRSYGFAGGTDFARQWGGTWALSMAWRLLTEHGVQATS